MTPYTHSDRYFLIPHTSYKAGTRPVAPVTLDDLFDGNEVDLFA